MHSIVCLFTHPHMNTTAKGFSSWYSVCVCVWACSLSLSTFHVLPGMKQSTLHTLTHTHTHTHTHTLPRGQHTHTLTQTHTQGYIHRPPHCPWLHIRSKEAVFYSSSCLFEWILHNALGITSHTYTHTYTSMHSERYVETPILRPDCTVFYSRGHGIITQKHTHTRTRIHFLVSY